MTIFSKKKKNDPIRIKTFYVEHKLDHHESTN
jgi:hypothetical protein